jgi:hypothetical protein
MKVKLESLLTIDECKSRLKSRTAQPFQPVVNPNFSIDAIVMGNRGSLVTRKYIVPGIILKNSLFPACRYTLEENNGGTTIDVTIGTQPLGIILLLLLLGVETYIVVSSVVQRGSGDFSFDGVLLYSIITILGFIFLLGGKMKDAPDTYIRFLKSRLGIYEPSGTPTAEN